MASLTALVAAREARGGVGGVVYLSDQAHASILRDLKVMGEREVRVLPSDAVVPAPGRGGGRGGRRRPRGGSDAVRGRGQRGDDEHAARSIRWTSWRTSALPRGCGSTSTAPTEPPRRSAPPGRSALAGMGRADSLTIDPHKWLFQPYEAGAVLIREPGLLEQTYAMSGEYLRDTFGGEVNFRDRDIQLTRGVRALKLWLSVQVFGLAAFRDAVAHGIALAEHAEARAPRTEGWEIVTPGAARDRLLRPRERQRVRDLRGHRPRRLRRTLDHRPPRPHRPPPLHHQPPHDLRRDRGDDRAHGAIEPLNPG